MAGILMMQGGSLRQTAQNLWHAQRIKRLVRDRLGHSAQGLVSVRETICMDPACEGPATEIRIVMLDFRETRVTIHKSLSQVSAVDIAEAF